MKNYVLKELTEEYAIEICNWKYEKEYAIYNFSDYSIVVKNGWDLAIKERREKEFVGIVYNDELIAYGRITSNCGKSIIGVGLKPILCGKGYGKDIMKLLIKECRKRYPQFPVTLEVRSFNKRAIKCYLDVGFEIKNKYIKETFNGKDEFYYMEYKFT
jgi:RimJ/RimL family protein N-acetyltransferase